jgi:hypothetical protein
MYKLYFVLTTYCNFYLTVALISTWNVFTAVSNTFTNEYYKGDAPLDILAVTGSYSGDISIKSEGIGELK